MRTALVEMLGPETNNWIGRRLRIFRRRTVRKNASGGTRERYEKAVECLDQPDREPRTTSAPKELDEIAASDIAWEEP